MRRKAYVQYVDVDKTFWMLFIVYGHALRGELTKWIYSFHVPLFFFLMGITFHYEDIDFITFLKKGYGIATTFFLMVFNKHYVI